LDLAAVRRTLAVDSSYVSDSGFVWRMLRSAGWNVANERTLDLLSGATYRAVGTPAAGDLVAYLQDGVPYHVGLLAQENQVVSATINAGVVRTPVDVFPGDVVYLRLMEPLPTATPAVTEPAAAPQPPPTPAVHEPRPARKRSRAQPSRTNGVKGHGKTAKHRVRTPAARAQPQPPTH